MCAIPVLVIYLTISRACENEILEIEAMEKRREQREEYNKMLENDIEVKV